MQWSNQNVPIRIVRRFHTGHNWGVSIAVVAMASVIGMFRHAAETVAVIVQWDLAYGDHPNDILLMGDHVGTLCNSNLSNGNNAHGQALLYLIRLCN